MQCYLLFAVCYFGRTTDGDRDKSTIFCDWELTRVHWENWWIEDQWFLPAAQFEELLKLHGCSAFLEQKNQLFDQTGCFCLSCNFSVQSLVQHLTGASLSLSLGGLSWPCCSSCNSPASSALSTASERSLAGPNCLCNELGSSVTVGCAIVCAALFTLSSQGALCLIFRESSSHSGCVAISSTHTHMHAHRPASLQHLSTAGSSRRRRSSSSSSSLMDMFVYLFVLDMINWSAG